MFENITIFEIVQMVFLGLSPILFLLGLFLIFYSKLQDLEAILDKDLLGEKSAKIRIPNIEENIYTFDRWLLKNKVFVGIVCIIAAVGFYMILRT